MSEVAKYQHNRNASHCILQAADALIQKTVVKQMQFVTHALTSPSQHIHQNKPDRIAEYSIVEFSSITVREPRR